MQFSLVIATCREHSVKPYKRAAKKRGVCLRKNTGETNREAETRKMKKKSRALPRNFLVYIVPLYLGINYTIQIDNHVIK